MQAPSMGTRGIVQSLLWRWQGHAAVPAIGTLCISPLPVPAGGLPAKPSVPAAPALLTTAPHLTRMKPSWGLGDLEVD